jgi:hypothetical protein
MSYNYRNALTGEYPDFEIDYESASVSQGNLPGAINPVASSDEAARVSFSWQPNTGQGQAAATDKAMVVVYNPSQKDAVYLLDAGTRADSTATVDLPVSYSGDVVHCYLAFMALGAALGGQTKNAISNSVYAGQVTVM